MMGIANKTTAVLLGLFLSLFFTAASAQQEVAMMNNQTQHNRMPFLIAKHDLRTVPSHGHNNNNKQSDYHKNFEAGMEAAHSTSMDYDDSKASCGTVCTDCQEPTDSVLLALVNESSDGHLVVKIGGQIHMLAPGDHSKTFQAGSGHTCFQILLWDGPTGALIGHYWSFPQFTALAEDVSIVPVLASSSSSIETALRPTAL